jgi:Leucine-rich repeat (LRR) protein
MNKNISLIIAAVFISFISVALYAQDYTHDSLAVRAILDSNGLDAVTVESVVDSGDGRIWRLKLNAKELTNLPSEIGDLTNLKFLELRTNNLTSLPPEIGNLTNLTSLELRSNSLTALPPEIGNLAVLSRLYLAFNDLTGLPPEIGNLTELRVLYLFFNKLTSLPPEIGNLTKLAELDLEGNELTGLPAEIGNCANLIFLSFNNNKLTAVPSEIGNLANLTTLYLPFNNLDDLPDSIVHITPTGDLDLGYNKLDSSNLSDTVIAWLDQYDPDWRETQTVPIIFNSDQYKQFPPCVMSQNNSNVVIRYYVAVPGQIKLSIINVQGRLITKLVDSFKQAGIYTVRWDGKGYGSGVYYLKFATGNRTCTKKMLIIR